MMTMDEPEDVSVEPRNLDEQYDDGDSEETGCETDGDDSEHVDVAAGDDKAVDPGVSASIQADPNEKTDDNRDDQNWHALIEEQRKTLGEMESILVCSEKIYTEEIRRQESLLMAAHHASLAKRSRELEEDVFWSNAHDFYSLMRGRMYINRMIMPGSSINQFSVSDQPSMKNGEITTYWDNGRFQMRPWNHDEYMMSMPSFAPGAKEPVSSRISRRGGPAKKSTEMSTNKVNAVAEQGPTEVRRGTGGRVSKVPLKVVPKSYQKNKIAQDEIAASSPAVKIAGGLMPPKMKYSGRPPMERTHNRVKVRSYTAGANR